MTPPPFDLDALRSEFPILQEKTYLNSCSLGALSRRSEAYLRDFLDRWHAMGASAWYEHWLGRVEELRGRVARFLDAPTETLALLPSTSVALSAVTESIPRHQGPEGDAGRTRIVTTELDFPTLPYQWAVKPEHEVVMLRSEDGVSVPPERFAEAVDERTLFVATSHVYFATGWIQDVAALARIAREAGAWSLIDGYQAPGQIAVDVRALGVDFYTTGPLKWLLGGPGLSYLYVREPLVRRLEPRLTSWFATEGQFDFDPEGFRYRDDARRFEMGTPALPTVHTALGGQEILDEVGIDAVEARNRGLTERLVEGCRDAGFPLRVAADPARRSAIVLVAHADPAGAVRGLAERDIVVDHRPGHVRVSPHVYNTDAEIDRFVTALREFRHPPEAP